jgi:aminopeptidase N
MGAMENKGLNVFNTKYVLASPDTATDVDYANVEGVVGHEYFHNWTGNRITCRDWFQLTLKEGLTVFRDQEFSADMSAGFLEGREDPTASAVERIANVRALRAVQFPEDAGPMAHPIRPDSYQEINNFYTATVYQKGAEVIRMQQALLGRAGFRAGMDEYVRRHDGQAVTCDDFVAAMESVYSAQHPGRNFDVFRRWYSQAGTPRVSVEGRYDPEEGTYTLTLRQICPKVGSERGSDGEKLPFHIPFAVGLLDPQGGEIALRLRNVEGLTRVAADGPGFTEVLDFTEAEQRFVFTGIVLPPGERPTPSLLRNFSAPVIVDYDYGDADLALLAMHDSDPFNRWEAGQRLAMRELVRLSKPATQDAGDARALNPALIDLYRATLQSSGLDPALKELALTLPSESVVGEALPIYDPQAVHAARVFVRNALAAALKDDWLAAYRANATPGSYSPDPASAGRRALKNVALGYLVAANDGDCARLAWKQFKSALKSAGNMTDLFAALAILTSAADPALEKKRVKALKVFYKRYRDDPLAVDKWLRVQATADAVGEPVLAVAQRLMEHEAFSLRNPNKVYALLAAFFSANPAEFHRPDGASYAFWVDQVLALDAINPSVASRMARMLDRWKKLTPELQTAAKTALERVQAASGLSRDVAEIVGKALAA